MARTEEPRLVTPDVTRQAVALLIDRLPSNWIVDVQVEQVPSAALGRRPAGALVVRGPDGRSATLLIEAKRNVEGRDIDSVVRRLTAYTSTAASTIGVLVTPYLGPTARATLAERGSSYIDATGNLRIQVDEPALYVSDRGADSDPRRGPGRPRGTLKGDPAAKVVRALVDLRVEEWSMRELIDVADVSTGAAYRVVDYLDREGLIERPGRGRVTPGKWNQLLRRWSDDYDFFTDATVTSWIDPRGLENLQTRLASVHPRTYALTGSIAAAEWAPYAPARNAMIYTPDARHLAELCGLRQVDVGANVLIAEPRTAVPFVRTRSTADELTIAAPAQVYVDLARGPGRSPSEAEALLSWMESDESSWRR